MIKAKPIVKATTLDKTITASTDSLTKPCNDAVTAITKKTAETKKLIAEVKRHTKKKAILTRRSKTAAAKLKKDPNAANKKAVTDVAKEIKLTSSQSLTDLHFLALTEHLRPATDLVMCNYLTTPI